MTQLTKTNGGNWAKQVGTGSDFESYEIFSTQAQAESRAAEMNASAPRHFGGTGQPVHRQIEVRECVAGSKLADRLGVSLGATCYMVGRSKRQNQVMRHATAAECIAAGCTPGPCNL